MDLLEYGPDSLKETNSEGINNYNKVNTAPASLVYALGIYTKFVNLSIYF